MTTPNESFLLNQLTSPLRLVLSQVDRRVPAMGRSVVVPCLPAWPAAVGRPLVHQAAPTLEGITARVGRLDGVLYRMGERGPSMDAAAGFGISPALEAAARKGGMPRSHFALDD